jgi:hypothetical protein
MPPGGRPLGPLAVLLAAMLCAAASAAAQPVCPVPPGAIGRITIERLEVLDADRPGAVGRLIRAANAIHIRTRERVIARELLFHEGEPCRSERLAETERNLRALGLFQRVSVIAAPASDGRVDVLVRARDAWSLRVSGRYQRIGGEPIWDLGVTEANIVGQGVAAGVRRRNGFEADITTAWLEDPRLAGSRERVSLRVDDRSDGHAVAATVARPFYAIDTRWSHDARFADTHDVLRLYQDGAMSASFDRRVTDAAAGFSARVARPAPLSVWRAGLGFRFIAIEYPGARDRGAISDDVPLAHRWAGPYVSLQFIEHRFVTGTGLVVPHRDVDVNLGTQAGIGAFVSPRVAAWRTSSRVIFDAGLSRGWTAFGGGIVIARAATTVRAGGGESNSADFTGSVRAWWQPSATHVAMAAGELRGTANPEPAYRVYLGGSPGLRGYRERAFQGTSSALLILEDRKFVDRTLAGLFQFGAAVFVEAGAVGGAPVTSGRRRVIADAGVGIRIATLRSSANGVIRVDLACPIVRAPDGRRRLQLVIGYRSDF